MDTYDFAPDPMTWLDNSQIEKHHRERVELGLSEFDFWNGDEYLAWVIINLITFHLNKGTGIPGRFIDEDDNVDEEAYRNELLTIRDAFMAYIDKEANLFRTDSGVNEKVSEAFDLLKELFGSLWD